MLWTVALQASLSMGFSRQEHWSGLPCPHPGDLPDPETEPTSLESPVLAGGFFMTSVTLETSFRRVSKIIWGQSSQPPIGGTEVLQAPQLLHFLEFFSVFCLSTTDV